MQTFNDFEKYSGLKWIFQKPRLCGLDTSGPRIISPVIQQNVHGRLNECQKLTNLWKLRSLSLFGKVAIIKSFLFRKLLYVSSIIETPPEIIKQIEKIFLYFFYGKALIKSLGSLW